MRVRIALQTIQAAARFGLREFATMALQRTTEPNINRQANHEWLRSHEEAVAMDRARLLVTERRWSWVRLGTFFAAALAWYPLGHEPVQTVIVTIGLFGLFAVAVGRHRAACSRRELADRLLVIIAESLSRCGGLVAVIRSSRRPDDPTDPAVEFAPVLDDGPTWTLTEQERDDLDLYASPVGLYGLLNRTSTSLGARRLREIIEHHCLSVEHIKIRQSAVRRLDQDVTQRLRMMAAAAVLRSQDEWLERLAIAIKGTVPLPWPSAALAMLTIWSVISAVVTVTALLLTGPGALGWLYLLLLLLSFNGFVYMRLKPVLNGCLGPWKAVGRAAAGYLHVAQQADADLPDTPELRPLRERFAAVVGRSVLPALGKRFGWADSGGMLHALCNVVFFFDLHVARSILRCAVPGRDKLLDGLGALAELEALCSLACFAYESDGRHSVCYPTVSGEMQLSITGGRHPLIPPDLAVPNDVHLRPPASTWVITGPNMAGKSTLLRMCGVNCLLAQIGTTALAERMTVTPARLITDLRIRDSLAKNESYFYAEVRHLRRMVLAGDDGSPILGLVDEPFRGTNSDEQVAASLALVEYLQVLTGFFLVATHEDRLAALAEQSDRAQNHHFHEELDKTGIVFDYRLRPGPAKARNALRVLEREGYPQELLARARDLLRNG